MIPFFVVIFFHPAAASMGCGIFFGSCLQAHPQGLPPCKPLSLETIYRVHFLQIVHPKVQKQDIMYVDK